MGKIKASALIDVFERMAREHWEYEWGAAREGCVDCSGAFVYAYKVLGGPAIAHGSNTIARKHCGPLVPAREAKPGYAVLKWREDGEPGRYENDGKDNFYHIGLMGRSGTVLNAKSTAAGFVESPLAGWTYAAPLLAVDYDETKGEDTLPEYTEVLYRAKVVTQNDPLNLREQPNTSSRKIGELPRGAVVDVVDTAVNAGWWKVRYGRLQGYASCAYLQRIDAEETLSGSCGTTSPIGGGEDADGVTAEAVTATTLVREDAQGCITLIGRWRVAED